ncbi:MAG: TRAM domain-containing protein, partial [Leptospiraceae bacterium]|nr:TRAM domain-containing protein [Leptospiraceae bacterium]
GEDIVIDVIKEGKDENQGIGYLEDGTMVVVENGRNLLGKTVQVNVTSIIQTAAGKMIFTRANGSGEPTQGGDDRGKGQGGDRNDRGDRDRGDRNERNDRGGGRRGNRDREAAGGGGRRRGR